MRCEWCGDLTWSVQKYGFAIHKEMCPHRVRARHQGNVHTITNNNAMERQQVYKSIDSERDYQDKSTADPSRPDMIEDFHVGDGLTAIQYNLDKAVDEWYKGAVPHQDALKYLRKIAGIIVKLGEVHGLPPRD